MKNLFARLVLGATLGSLLISIKPALAQGTAFTYQGQLQNNGSPASGTYNLTFSLFNASSGSGLLGEPVTNNGVTVSNGLFTVLIDLAPAYSPARPTGCRLGWRLTGPALSPP